MQVFRTRELWKTAQNIEKTTKLFCSALNLKSPTELKAACSRLSFADLVSLEDQMRRKGAWFLLRIDEKIILKVPSEPKIPYILGRQRSLKIKISIIF